MITKEYTIPSVGFRWAEGISYFPTESLGIQQTWGAYNSIYIYNILYICIVYIYIIGNNLFFWLRISKSKSYAGIYISYKKRKVRLQPIRQGLATKKRWQHNPAWSRLKVLGNTYLVCFVYDVSLYGPSLSHTA